MAKTRNDQAAPLFRFEAASAAVPMRRMAPSTPVPRVTLASLTWRPRMS